MGREPRARANRSAPGGGELPSELDAADRERVELQQRLYAAARSALPQDPFPHYLGHVRSVRAGQVSDVLFTAGHRPRTSPPAGVFVADWIDSPQAAALFAGNAGRRQATHAAAERASVVQRNVVSFERRALVEVITPDAVLTRRETGAWQRQPHAAPQLLARSEQAKSQQPSLTGSRRRSPAAGYGAPISSTCSATES